MFYSKSTGGFYDDPKNYKEFPLDAVEITDSQYAAACSAPEHGTILSADENGYPIMVYPAAKTNAQLKYEELAILLSQYKSSLQEFQMSWLSAIVADGATEESKKLIITQDIAALKAQYLVDVAAVKSKYGV